MSIIQVINNNIMMVDLNLPHFNYLGTQYKNKFLHVERNIFFRISICSKNNSTDIKCIKTMYHKLNNIVKLFDSTLIKKETAQITFKYNSTDYLIKLPIDILIASKDFHEFTFKPDINSISLQSVYNFIICTINVDFSKMISDLNCQLPLISNKNGLVV